jgi:hypothetical protein
MKSKPPSNEVVDTRSASERALGESQANYFKGLMEQPDWGWKSESAAQDPLYARERARMEEQISGSAAERGFGALRHGPSMELSARGSQEMAENRVASDVANRDAYRRWVTSSGREAGTPMGRSVVSQPGRPSAFSQLMQPVMTGVGYGIGGPVGGMIGSKVGGMFNQPQGQPTVSSSDQIRSRYQ